jgi:DNA ligase-1
MITKTMHSATAHSADFDRIDWPVLASPKLHGIRCLIHPELGPVSRTWKPIANIHIRTMLAQHWDRTYLDGELVAMDENGED